MQSPTGRVLMVLPNGGTGGMQAQVQIVSEALVANGHEVAVLVGGLPEPEIRNGVRYIAAPSFSLRGGWAFWRSLRRVIRTFQPTVVHGHGLRTGPLVAVSSRAARRFVTCHGIDPRSVSTALLTMLRILPITVVSCGLGPQRVLATRGLRTVVLNNATPVQTRSQPRREFDERFGTTPSDFVALWPARFSEQKNHESLLAFAESLVDTNIVVICCGDGPLRAGFEHKIADRGLSKYLRAADYVDGAGQWLGATDFFVLPSHWEGQPLVLLEALAHRVPSVTWTPVGAEELPAQWHFASAEEAADAIRQLISMPSLRDEMTRSFDEIVLRHQVERVISQYENLYYS